MKKIKGLLISSLFLAMFLLSSRLVAATPTSPTGITLSPAFQQVTLNATEPQHEVKFKITNNKNTSQIINLTTADFNSLEDTGGLFFVGANPTDLQKKYGLAKWLSLPQNNLTLAPKQTVTITANILNLDTMPSGGHYGALMLELGSGGGPNPKNQVAIHPIASSLLFVTKLGGDTHRLRLDKASFNHNFLAQPGTVNLTFHNSGNTHLVPRGIVTLSKGTTVVSRGIINENSDILLPELSRQYVVPLKHVAAALWPGQYKLRVDFRFDGLDQFRSYQTSLWLIPPLGIFILLILVTAGVIGWQRLTSKKNKQRAKT